MFVVGKQTCRDVVNEGAHLLEIFLCSPVGSYKGSSL